MSQEHIVSRRDFLLSTAGATAAALAIPSTILAAETAQPQMIVLPPLPYPENALAPTISERTVHIHYNNHHRSFVDKANAMLKDTKYIGWPLDKIVKETFSGINKEETLHYGTTDMEP
jgi:Fe-Mn family superoxide dismutase